MNNLLLLTGLALASSGTACAQATWPAPPPDQPLEIVARVESPDFSGVAVTTDNRVFLGFPRHADNHQQFSLAEWKDGKLTPWPSRELTYPSTKPYREWLVSPHGLTLDAKGRLWVIDDGKRAGIDGIPEGAAKVVGFEVKTGRIIANVVLYAPVLRPDMHLNDLRIDLTHGAQGTAYITNSSFGTTPSLMVVDLATGQAREVLRGHPSTAPEPGFLAFLEQQPHVYQAKNATFPTGGADGIALSPDSRRVFWTTLSGHKLYSLSTDSLSNQALADADLANVIKYEGEHPACDGLAEDAQGNIYFGAFEQQSLTKRSPNGQYTRLLHDERLSWPDGLFFQNGYLYVTLGQWNRLPDMNHGHDLRQPPYLLGRVRVPL